MQVNNFMDELPSTSTDFIVIDSQRGGKVLLLNGYRYNMRRVNNNEHTVWRCVKVKCTGNIRHYKLTKYVGQFQNFLFADYCDKKTRILLFASEEGREILKQAKEFHYFEFSVLAAIRKVFPESKSRGCLFHFSQAVWRKAKQIGLTKSKVFPLKRCIALAYLPRELKSDGWLYILGEYHDVYAEIFNNHKYLKIG
ncbi:hypothetical protein ABMA28_001478 [Loxostege sticticalis]|uniref:FLYWCH-type domain-containing protein n=1 Tax=Loxostege sticticalis TaxID=481309 RepID=A0ABD0T1U9_LOXSC